MSRKKKNNVVVDPVIGKDDAQEPENIQPDADADGNEEKTTEEKDVSNNDIECSVEITAKNVDNPKAEYTHYADTLDRESHGSDAENEDDTDTSGENDNRPEIYVREESDIKPDEELQPCLIRMIDICKFYHMGDEVIKANDHINLKVEQGEFVSIVGKSGSGKSTLMNIIGALDVPTSGTYLLDGEDVGKMNDNQLADFRNRKIGFVFQQYNLLPKLTVRENVELPLLYAKLSKKERSEKAMEALARVGLESKSTNMPNQLSGGQQQRVSIARALAGSPSILLADEPTGALDSKTGIQILEFFKELNEEGNTVIMITHDNAIALKARRVARITDGRIDFDGKAEDYGRII